MILTTPAVRWSEARLAYLAARGHAGAIATDPSGSFGKGDVLRVERLTNQPGTV